MKKIKYYILMLIVPLFVISCDDFMDVHKDYIKGGEIMYAPKVDSLMVYPGKDRIKMKFWVYNATFVETLHIYWGSSKDSLIVPVSFKHGMDSLEVIIDNLNENSYTFDVKTKDARGVWSLNSTGFGSAYGDDFQATLTSRGVKSAVMNNGSGEVSWLSADEKLFCTEVKYTTLDGEEKILRSGQEDQITICESADPEKGFIHRSLFLPEEAAIDTFYTAWSDNIGFPVIMDRTDWELVSFTTEAGGYPASNILDGNMNSFWHSNWNAPIPEFPYDIVIDMKVNVMVNMIDIYRRLGNTDTKSFRAYVSADNDTWDLGGTFTFGSGDNLKASFDTPLLGRYLKLQFFESNKTDRSISVAEVYVVGTIPH